MHTLPTYLAPVCGPVLRHVPRAGGVGGHAGTQRYDIIRQRDENIKREAFVYIINLARLDNMNFSDSSTNRASSYVSGLRLAVLCVRINI